MIVCKDTVMDLPLEKFIRAIPSYRATHPRRFGVNRFHYCRNTPYTPHQRVVALRCELRWYERHRLKEEKDVEN